MPSELTAEAMRATAPWPEFHPDTATFKDWQKFARQHWPALIAAVEERERQAKRIAELEVGWDATTDSYKLRFRAAHRISEERRERIAALEAELAAAIRKAEQRGRSQTFEVAVRETEIRTLEEAAKIASDADKSTHPADIAQAIRERIAAYLNAKRPGPQAARAPGSEA